MTELNPKAWQVACALGNYNWRDLPLTMLRSMPYQGFDALRTNTVTTYICGGQARITVTRYYEPRTKSKSRAAEFLLQFFKPEAGRPDGFAVKFRAAPAYKKQFGEQPAESKTWLGCRKDIVRAVAIAEQIEKDLEPLVEATEELVEEKRREQGT